MSLPHAGPTMDDPSRRSATADPWQATRAQTTISTQIMRHDEDDASPGQRDIGRPVSANERELFVSCDPALAMQQQFEHLDPEFIAVHDIGTTSSRRLLSGVAAASGRAVQKLTIRRQGFGMPLATLEFVELPTTDGSSLRLYTTEADADTLTRQALVRKLLAFSRLGVVLVGDLPAHAIEAAFRPLREEMIAGPWPNRHLLLLPLGAATAVAGLGADLARGTAIHVRTTPQVTRPADAWSFINGAYARVREDMSVPPPQRVAPAAPARSFFTPRGEDAPTSPLPLRPMPQVPTARERPAAGNILERYVQQLSELGGMVSVCIFELSTGRDVAHAGASPAPDQLGQHGAELVASITATCRVLGLGHAIPEAAITLGAHHLLLRPVPRHPHLALHAVLDKSHANLTLARLQVQRIDAIFDEPAH